MESLSWAERLLGLWSYDKGEYEGDVEMHMIMHEVEKHVAFLLILQYNSDQPTQTVLQTMHSHFILMNSMLQNGSSK